jgi:hypothetical protein
MMMLAWHTPSLSTHQHSHAPHHPDPSVINDLPIRPSGLFSFLASKLVNH